MLFSIGNIKPLFQKAFPACWGSKPTICNPTWIAAVEYLEICGIIVGQILVGILGDWYDPKPEYIDTTWSLTVGPGSVVDGVSFRMR